MSGYGDVDHVLLAMNSHDLKRVVHGLVGMLGSFATDVSLELERGRSDEMAQIANHIADMQHAVGGMLSNLDQIILMLGRTCPSAGHIGALVQHFDMDRHSPHGLAINSERDSWGREISELPPHIGNL